MDDTIRRFREHLRRKEFGRLDDCWLELLDSDVGLEQLIELAGLAERHGPAGQAAELLALLAEALGDKRDFAGQLTVLRRLVETSGDLAGLAERLAHCFRHLHPGMPELEKLLQKAGLGYGHPLREALERLDGYLAFLPGRWVYDRRTGPGVITRVDHLLDRVTVRWRTGTDETLGLEAARTRLRATPADGFFSRLAGDGPGLARLAAESPAAVVRLLLRDLDHPASVDDLDCYLRDLVDVGNREGFWDRARRGLARDPHVALATKPARSYVWSSAPITKTAARSPLPRRRSDTPGENDLADLEPGDISLAYERLSASPQRRRFLGDIMAQRPGDWVELMARLFHVDSDRRARSLIEKSLSAEHPAAWRQVLEAALTDYRQHPGAFVWLAENAVRTGFDNLPGVVSRLLDLLESSSHRSQWPALRSALTASDLALLRAAVETVDEQGARRLAGRLERMRGLGEFHKDEIKNAFATRFPALGQAPADAILGTASSIRHAHDELTRLVRQELPAVAEEIGRARAHGDLSENYEYKAAREKQARLMAKINRLRQDLARARALVPGDIDTTQVSVGCRVRLRGDDGRLVEYSLLGPWDSDPDSGIISYLAPLGQQLLERRPGDGVEIDNQMFTIERIERAVQ